MRLFSCKLIIAPFVVCEELNASLLSERLGRPGGKEEHSMFVLSMPITAVCRRKYLNFVISS